MLLYIVTKLYMFYAIIGVTQRLSVLRPGPIFDYFFAARRTLAREFLFKIKMATSEFTGGNINFIYLLTCIDVFKHHNIQNVKGRQTRTLFRKILIVIDNHAVQYGRFFTLALTLTKTKTNEAVNLIP